MAAWKTKTPEEVAYEMRLKDTRRDATQYPEFKNDTTFNNWRRTFVSVAKTHNVKHVLDPQFVPQAHEVPLWDEQQKFMFWVFNTTLLTDVGKSLVRKHEHDADAQAVWTELVQDTTSSTKAKMAASDILSYITSASLDSNWKGTSHGFVLYWENKVREYDMMITDPADRFSSNQKLAMLKNIIEWTPDLCNVRINADIEAAKGGTRLTYDQYRSLLISACQAYDKKMN